MLNKITENEKRMFSKAIYYYANSDEYTRSTVTVDYLLRFWAEEKEKFYNMFGQNLILTKEIDYLEPRVLIENKMSELVCSSYFCKQYRKIFDDFWLDDSPYAELRKYDYSFRRILSAYCLTESYYDGPTFVINVDNNKSVKIENGCKIIKTLRKIAEIFNIPGFEEFKLEHSRILNVKRLKGKLNLSIHPLDFITMSDNDSDWNSCMSWINFGCYRRGTVEMMNSPMVIVAYLSSERDMEYCGGSWNNKKWRQLFIVNDDIITNVKAYPYKSDYLTDVCLEWLRSLVNNYYSEDRFTAPIYKYNSDVSDYIEFNDKKYLINICPNTNTMYNDFSCDQRGIISNKFFTENFNNFPELIKFLSFNYSGKEICMVCGEEEWFDDEAKLYGENCSPYDGRCEICEEECRSEDLTEVDGVYYCPSCYNDCVSICPITGAAHNYNDMVELCILTRSNHGYYAPVSTTGYLGVDAVSILKEIYNVKIYKFTFDNRCREKTVAIYIEDIEDKEKFAADFGITVEILEGIAKYNYSNFSYDVVPATEY